MRGELGIPLSSLTPQQLTQIEQILTRQKRQWDEDKAPEQVVCTSFTEHHLWVPRHANTNRWSQVQSWEWAQGDPYPFQVQIPLDPERGQTVSVPRMVDYLKRHSGGILVAPTGTGKTLCALAIGAHFQRHIGVLIYVGHMQDNWAQHAQKVLGLRDDQIGVYQEDRCDLGRPVTLISLQTVLARGVPQALQKQIGFICLDEVHRHGATRFRDAAAQFPARYRLGLSADPVRKDGLQDVVNWTVGHVGHTAPRIRTEEVKAPDVTMVYFPGVSYAEMRFHRFERGPTGWTMGDPDTGKYDSLLARDHVRTASIAMDIADACAKGRQILVLSSRVEHLEKLRALVRRRLDPVHPVLRLARALPYPPGHKHVQLATLAADMAPEARQEVQERADVIFATFVMARDALNVPRLDTLFFATPPGSPLQPIGRLREKAEGIERQPLMVVDYSESGVWPGERAKYRRNAFIRLGCSITEHTRVLSV